MLTFNQIIEQQEHIESLIEYIYYTYGESKLSESIDYFQSSLRFYVHHAYSHFSLLAVKYNYLGSNHLGVKYDQRLVYLHDELRENLFFTLYDTNRAVEYIISYDHNLIQIEYRLFTHSVNREVIKHENDYVVDISDFYRNFKLFLSSVKDTYCIV